MRSRKLLTIAIDFDGTCVTHEFPKIGKEIGADIVLKKLTAEGHRLILWTMRSDIENPISNDPEILPIGGNYLSEAVQWFKDRDIDLFGINNNPEQKSWTTSPKAYADLYIDDAACCCPVKFDANLSHRAFVDWKKLDELFTNDLY
jgi:hypothetical protein